MEISDDPETSKFLSQRLANLEQVCIAPECTIAYWMLICLLLQDITAQEKQLIAVSTVAKNLISANSERSTSIAECKDAITAK